ncbi:DUF4893 domain-containing protein [Sphingomicrobium astaxanthinifaciens]|uniref:DUF4893 domain-containing protein n=1 Tax=Sphingomicrobium astaxanthinifaciens TaxID=1227949 RepID=UPI001FCBA816|nr:DUF4893 domain-containing protein [Sphingomicrobium astaxanthinifaciens]MCJ7420725.1 DUF4893 domain-containing protein [Sphingomicrobium astaxanthinifaciens]
MTRLLSFLAPLLALAGCTSLPGAPTIETLDSRDWRAVASDADADRLRATRATFAAALAEARDKGFGAEIDALGPLADPDLLLPLERVPTGRLRCRTIKLGTKDGRGDRAYVAYPPFECRIRPEGGLYGFAKLTGSQRPVGLLFPDDAYREVFLGTLVLGDEDRAMRYGADPGRDMIGALQRVGKARYRLLVPSPRFESRLDIIDLVPEN